MSTLNYLGSILEGINSGINNGLKIEENRRANEVLLMQKKREREEERIFSAPGDNQNLRKRFFCLHQKTN